MTNKTNLGAVLLDIQAGKSFLTAEVAARPDELGVLKVSAVTWTEFRAHEAKSLKGDYTPDASHRVRKDDLIISRANTKELVGAVALVDRDYPLRLLSDKTLRLVIDERRASKGYLLFALRTGMAREHIERFATGTSDSMRNISHGAIRSIPICLPDLGRQIEIADALRDQMAEVNRARQASQAQKYDATCLADAVYRAVFQNTIPVRLPPGPFGAPSGWAWRKITDVARLESGHTPSRLRADWWGGDISWISLTEIRALDGKWVEQTQIRTNPEGIANSAARVLPAGTVCLSRTASVGFVTIMAQPMATSQDFANWVCGSGLDPEYLMHALICSRPSLRDMATGATHKTIYMPALGSLQVCAPEIAEQKRIVLQLKAQLEQVRCLRAALDSQFADVSALPQRLLAQTFQT